MFFNMYSFTEFIIFVTEPCLFSNTILLEHASLHQRTMHCPLLACVCLLPCTFHFQVIHRLTTTHHQRVRWCQTGTPQWEMESFSIKPSIQNGGL